MQGDKPERVDAKLWGELESASSSEEEEEEEEQEEQQEGEEAEPDESGLETPIAGSVYGRCMYGYVYLHQIVHLVSVKESRTAIIH